MSRLGTTIVVLTTIVSGSSAAAAGAPPYVSSDHWRVIDAWLNAHGQSRIASDADCRCADDLKRERTESSGQWRANPNYHPYYVAGDFNGDGATDFAIGIIEKGASGVFRVAVFNGPFGKTGVHQPAFLSEPLPLGQGMFFGAPRPKPYRLVIGPFESHGALLEPAAKGYLLKVEKQ